MKDWYLIKRPSMTSGGFENEVFNDFKDDAMYDILDTEIATDVLLCNYDLSETQQIRCIIQGNTGNTLVQSIDRTVLFPIGTVKAGMYLFFENCYWLITGYPGNNKVYEKATVVLCQYLLRWQNSAGEIIERWVNLDNSSGSSNGVENDNEIDLSTADYQIKIPNDQESLLLDEKRVFIDFQNQNPTKVFKITRNNDCAYEYGTHGGILKLLAEKGEYNFKTDNQELKICDYISPSQPSTSDESGVSTSVYSISYTGQPTVRYGGRAKTFKLTDSDGNVAGDVSWTIEGYFDGINITKDSGGEIQLKIDDDESLISEQFTLKAYVDDVPVASLIITIVD